MIVVLSAEVKDDALVRVRDGLGALGWKCEESRGEEQVVLVLSGDGERAGLERALSHGGTADVFPVLSGRGYRRLRVQRRFMAALAFGLALLIAAGILLPILGFLLPQAESLSDPDVVRVFAAEKLREDTARLASFHGRPVMIVRLPGQRFFALSALCTHVEACQLEWSPELHRLECPCHGDSYDLYGNVLHGPAALPLVRYEVARRGDNLYLRRKG